MPKPITDMEVRFWKHVDKTDTCWNWTGGKTEGYGMFRVSNYPRKMRGAHRVSYEMHAGPIPAGKVIDHRCRNRLCVRPDHLRVVTQKQNGEHKAVESHGRSGVRGVFWHGQVGKWAVQVRHNGKLYRGGFFSAVEDAAVAVRDLRNELYTHNDLDRSAHASASQPTTPTEAL